MQRRGLAWGSWNYQHQGCDCPRTHQDGGRSISGRPSVSYQFVEHLDGFVWNFDGENEPLMSDFDREGEEWTACDLTSGKLDKLSDVGPF
jgi:hypothetical protein